MVINVLTWAAAAAAYLLFAGQFSPEELVAAGVCGLLAAAWSAALRAGAAVRFRFDGGAAAAMARAVAGLPKATAGVGLALLRAVAVRSPLARSPGRTARESFVPGPRRDPLAAGRRAVAVLARSLAPDSFVVRIPEEREEIDVHQLAKTARAEDSWGAA